MDGDVPPFPSKQPHYGLLERSTRIKMAAEIGLARSSRGRHWSRALHRRLRNTTTTPTTVSKNEMSDLIPSSSSSSSALTVGEDAMEDRVQALQRLVPGGEELSVDRLFEETANYIEALEEQVSTMRALACLLDGLEREKKRMMVMGG